ncbi:uncharacterized protein LOC101235563 isoform X3 [Hydra vulgaris]|uniref:Uncharacterized protein LOC101235563 isoform X3 n=1 Tax=Hydra vulgaris TaxID=6087 RepID=A0ABM4BLF9_HYDVU
MDQNLTSTANLSTKDNVTTSSFVERNGVPSALCGIGVNEFEKSDCNHSVSYHNKLITTSDIKMGTLDGLVFSSNNFPSTLVIPSPILSSSNKGNYFCVSTEKEVEDIIRIHTQDTYSHFVVAKKTKAYGSTVSSIDITSKFRIHWQSRDLTSTEECAVQIPFQGVPFIYIGEKAYMCHLGRNKTRLKDVPHINENMPKKHRSRMTKKLGCSAKIFVKQIAKFPQFKISHNSEYLRTQSSQKLRNALQTSEGKLDHIIEYIGTLPDIFEHTNHEIGENTVVKEPIDPLIKEKIMELTWIYGEQSLLSIKNDLEDYVKNLFQDSNPPLKNRRRYYPNDKDVANYFYKFRLFNKLTPQDVAQLNQLVDTLKENHDERLFYLNIEEDLELSSNIESKNIFIFQTTDQQRLLERYGRQVIFVEVTSKYQCIPFPLFALYVATNVDYQLVFLFLIPSHSQSGIRCGLKKALEWNSQWNPKYFVLDCCEEYVSIIEEIFIDSLVYLSEATCISAWKSWLNDFMHLNCIEKEENLLDRFVSIARSFTEETLQESAQKLEKSNTWKCSDDLRNWFSTKWLAEAKRWVVGYRHDQFIPTHHLEANLYNDISMLCDMHFNYIKNRKLHNFINYLVDSYVPEAYRRYIDTNIADYEKHILLTKADSTPSFLRNRPVTVGSHIIQRISNDNSFSVAQIQTGVFMLLNKENHDKSYHVSFGDSSSFPSCTCDDWFWYKLPCKHILSVFETINGQGWDMLPSIYTGSPLYNYDFSCFDKNCENSLTLEKSVDCSNINLSKTNKVLTNHTIASTHLNFDDEYKNELISNCKTIIETLSSALFQVNHNVLQKVQLDLQLIMNYINQEKSAPSLFDSPKKRHSSSPQPEKYKRYKDNTVLHENKVESLNVCVNNLLESPNGDWIADNKLNIKLSRQDRNKILSNFPITVDVIECSQTILKCQFNDVFGLYNSQMLSQITDEIFDYDKTKRILQIHFADNGHWAATGKIGDEIYTFCCEHCDKSKIKKQLISLTLQDIEKSIIFVERSDDEKLYQCGMYAIAYCVSMAIGVDPRNINFVEQEMRLHLVEYLENMCFSMFPFNVA